MLEPKYLDLDGTFLFFAACCFGMSVFVLLALPETKGVSLDDMSKVRAIPSP